MSQRKLQSSPISNCPRKNEWETVLGQGLIGDYPIKFPAQTPGKPSPWILFNLSLS